MSSAGRNRIARSPDFRASNAAFEQAFPELIPGRRIGQIEGKEQIPGADRGNDRKLHRNSVQPIDKMFTGSARVLDQILLFDDLKEMSRAHHIGKISAPG